MLLLTLLAGGVCTVAAAVISIAGGGSIPFVAKKVTLRLPDGSVLEMAVRSAPFRGADGLLTANLSGRPLSLLAGSGTRQTGSMTELYVPDPYVLTKFQPGPVTKNADGSFSIRYEDSGGHGAFTYSISHDLVCDPQNLTLMIDHCLSTSSSH